MKYKVTAKFIISEVQEINAEDSGEAIEKALEIFSNRMSNLDRSSLEIFASEGITCTFVDRDHLGAIYPENVKEMALFK